MSCVSPFRGEFRPLPPQLRIPEVRPQKRFSGIPFVDERSTPGELSLSSKNLIVSLHGVHSYCGPVRCLSFMMDLIVSTICYEELTMGVEIDFEARKHSRNNIDSFLGEGAR